MKMENNNIRYSTFSRMSHNTYNPSLRLVSKQFRNTYNQNKMHKRSKVHNVSKKFLLWLERFMKKDIYNHIPFLKHYLRISSGRSPTNTKRLKEKYKKEINEYDVLHTLWYEKDEKRHTHQLKKQNTLIDKLVRFFLHLYINRSKSIRIGDFVFLNFGTLEEYQFVYQVSERNSKKIITSKPLPLSIRKEIKEIPEFYKNIIEKNNHKIDPRFLEQFQIGIHWWNGAGEALSHNTLKTVLQYYYNQKYINNPNKLTVHTPLIQQPNKKEKEWYKRNFNKNTAKEFIEMYKKSKSYL